MPMDLLVLFVREAGKLYGREIYVYNVHCLIHLANDVKNLGVLDDFSAFPYENYFGKLKKMIRKSQFPLQQLANRLAEQELVGHDSVTDQFCGVPSVKSEHHCGLLLPAYSSYNQYRWLHMDKYKLSSSSGNNCILSKDGSVVLIRNIAANNGDIILICNKFANVDDAFVYPLPSSKLGIFKVSREDDDLFPLSLWEIAGKCVLMPFDEHRCDFLSFPLLH